MSPADAETPLELLSCTASPWPDEAQLCCEVLCYPQQQPPLCFERFSQQELCPTSEQPAETKSPETTSSVVDYTY